VAFLLFFPFLHGGVEGVEILGFGEVRVILNDS
jgi:hypothetical protein